MRAMSKRAKAGRAAVVITEFAFCCIPFFLMMFGLLEFGRMYMVVQILQAAARTGARQGITENVTTSQVIAAMQGMVHTGGLSTSQVNFYVLDGKVFDEDPFGDPNTMMSSLIEANEPYEIANAEPRQLSVVRCDVRFKDVALIKGALFFNFLDDVMLRGQVVVRKE